MEYLHRCFVAPPRSETAGPIGTCVDRFEGVEFTNTPTGKVTLN